MTFAVIVQARMGSSRLPGKVLEPLGAASVLARCLERCAAIPGVDAVVCATPDGLDDDAVAAEAFRAGAFVIRGSEDDVLSRYAFAARAVKADIVMRVTADCPFIDPALCGEVRDALIAQNAAYATNNLPPTFPHGLDCDAFPAERLFAAAREADCRFDREHVSPWVRRTAEGARAVVTGPGGPAARLRWTLDHPADLSFFRAVFGVMGEAAATARWTEIADLCLTRHDVAQINAAYVDEARLAAGASWGLRALEPRLAAGAAS